MAAPAPARARAASAADLGRFRRVLRALELREEKKRLKEATREITDWLERDPHSQLGRAAKATVLEQTGGGARHGEALALAKTVLAEGPADEHTLNCVAGVLKALGHSGELTRHLEARAAQRAAA